MRGGVFYRLHDGQTTARERDSFFLKSMLRADLHILDQIPLKLKNIRNVIQRRMFSTFIEFSRFCHDEALAMRVYKHLRLTSVSSVRMAIFKIFGPNIYNQITKVF